MVPLENLCGLHSVSLVSELPVVAPQLLPRNPGILAWFFSCQNKLKGSEDVRVTVAT